MTTVIEQPLATAIHPLKPVAETTEQKQSVWLRLVLFTTLLAVLAPSGRIEAADPTVIDKVIQLGGDGKKHFLAFCGHGEGVGHAFVTIGVHDDKRQLCESLSIGFYPEVGKANALRAIFSKVDSGLADELKRGKIEKSSCRLVVAVSPEQYAKAEDKIKEWAKKSKDYQLGASDCVSFTAEIARVLELKTPDHKLIAVKKDEAAWPVTFLRKLVEMNDSSK